MRIFQRMVAALIMLLGCVHSAFSPVFHGRYDDAGMWFLSGGLMMIFLGLLNLARSASTSAIAHWATLLANALTLAFALALLPIFPHAPQLMVFVTVVVAATTLSAIRHLTPSA